MIRVSVNTAAADTPRSINVPASGVNKVGFLAVLLIRISFRPNEATAEEIAITLSANDSSPKFAVPKYLAISTVVISDDEILARRSRYNLSSVDVNIALMIVLLLLVICIVLCLLFKAAHLALAVGISCSG